MGNPVDGKPTPSVTSSFQETIEGRRLIIHGLVQGVGFRQAMCREAERLGAGGWVRNRHDGTVEALVSGDALTLAALLHWSRQGPPAARVMQVEVEMADPRPPGFGILPTA